MSAATEIIIDSGGITEIVLLAAGTAITFAPGPDTEIVMADVGSLSIASAQTDVSLGQDSATEIEVIVGSQSETEIEMAATGPQGRPGPPGGASIKYPFSWGDATPASLGEHIGVVVAVSIVILTPFNGEPSLISISAGAAPLMTADQNLPSEAARYEANPGVRLAAVTLITLSITPGLGTSAGNGIAYLEIAQ